MADLRNLNDLRFFAEVVDEGGFAAAARKLGMPRSRLSRRIGLLEDGLGVRLIHRSTRRFVVTEIGQDYYRHCVAMMVEAEAAQEAIDRVRSEPQGTVRVTCLSSVIYFHLGDMISRFMAIHPKVDVQLESTNRRVDVIREGIDMAIRVSFPPLDASDLVVRKLSDSVQRLVASPKLLEGRPFPLDPADVGQFPSMAWESDKRDHEWHLEWPGHPPVTIRHKPRFLTEDMVALRHAALLGVGVAQFPTFMVREDLAAGRLIDVLPGWTPRTAVVHAVFPSRRGMLPSVRTLLDFLADAYTGLNAGEAAGLSR